MTMRIQTIFAALIALASAAPALAAPLELASEVFVERELKRADGSVTTVLEAPKLVVPGDQLVFVLRYKNAGAAPASKFTITNPLPKAVAFVGTADGTEIVSVDGGKSWGALPQLKISNADGTLRPAFAGDVTHIKWDLNHMLAAGSAGQLIFRGVVK